MILRLVLDGIARGKARFACAVIGTTLAVGALVFMGSLVATNNAQAPFLARKACVPWAAWRLDEGKSAPLKADLSLSVVRTSIDYRPGGRVLQGPPMRALLAEAPEANPYEAVSLSDGRWVNATSSEAEVVCVRRAMRRFGRLPEPKLGDLLKFVGRTGTMTARVVGYLDGEKLPREFPTVFANRSAFAALSGEHRGRIHFLRRVVSDDPTLLTPDSESVIKSFKMDDQRRMDYATPLLLIAAFLTALSLLVNSLLLSVESNRATLSILRTIGLTRFGVVSYVFVESVLAGALGWLFGAVLAAVALVGWVTLDPASFPAGPALATNRLLLTLLLLPVVILIAVLFALAPALRVRALDVRMRRQRRRCVGMAVTFACGFAAFVAVEVWGASLMRGFVPSPEWPDAIVSILPGGVSSFDIEKVRGLKGVRRISELQPLQLPTREKRNALFLASEWLPKFEFLEGDWESAEKAIRSSDAVVITEMMSRAYDLHCGDRLSVTIGRGERAQTESLPVAGVVDLNWHMVTSRGLVRGLNGASPMTDGPVFCSFDTLESLDFRPAPMVKMTHLWVEYESAFLKEHGVFPAGRLIEQEIVRRLGNPESSTIRLHARDEIADGTLAHGSDLIGQAARIPFVFLAILAIGFVAMLVAEADARKREFAILRAVGATRGQIAARLCRSALRTAAIGILIGLPIGSFAGWLVAIKTASVWPGMPHWFVVPWQVIFEGAVGAIVFALIFAVPAAVRLSRNK